MHGVFVGEGGRFDLGEVELRNIHKGARFFLDSHVHTTASDGERTPQERRMRLIVGVILSSSRTIIRSWGRRRRRRSLSGSGTLWGM